MLTAELNKTRKIGIEIEAVLPDTSGAWSVGSSTAAR